MSIAEPNLMDEAYVGPRQIKVLEHIWKHGESSVHQLHEALNATSAAAGMKQLAYTTVLTICRNLARRKMVSQRGTPGQRHHRFSAIIGKREFRARFTRAILLTYFDDDLAALNSAAVDSVAMPRVGA